MELKKAPPPVSDINVTPMVDVMLVVLIIFMVITPMLNKGANIDLATARNPIAMPDADKEDAVIVAITRDGQVFLSPGLQKSAARRSRAEGEGSAGGPARARSSISGRTRGAKYEAVEDVVDNLRAGGVDDVGLLTEQDLTNAVQPTKQSREAASGA